MNSSQIHGRYSRWRLISSSKLCDSGVLQISKYSTKREVLTCKQTFLYIVRQYRTVWEVNRAREVKLRGVFFSRIDCIWGEVNYIKLNRKQDSWDTFFNWHRSAAEAANNQKSIGVNKFQRYGRSFVQHISLDSPLVTLEDPYTRYPSR